MGDMIFRIVDVINVVFIISCTLGLIFSAIKGYKRGFYKSLLRLGIRLVSIALAAILSKIFVKMAFSSIVDKIIPLIVEASENLFDKSNIEPIISLTMALINPIVYVILAGVLELLLLIVYLIVKRFLPKIEAPLLQSAGIGVNIVSWIVSFVFISLPMMGYLNLGLSSTTTMLAQGGSIGEIEQLKEMKDAEGTINYINDQFVFKVTAKPSQAMLGLFTGVEYKGVSGKTYKTNAVKELKGLQELSMELSDVLNLGDSQEKPSMDTLNSIVSALDYKGKNSIYILKITLTDVLVQASTKWKEGEEYFNINIKEMLEEEGMGEDFFNLVSGVFDKLSKCNEQNMLKHLKSIANLAKAVMDTMDLMEDTANYISNLSSGTATSASLGDNVVKMNNIGANLDDINRETYYNLQKNFVKESGGEIYFAGIILEELQKNHSQSTYNAQLEAVNESLLNLFYLIEQTDSTQLQNKVNALIDKVIVKDSVFYNSILKAKQINSNNAEKIEFEISQSKYSLLDYAISEKKASCTQEQKDVLDAFKQLFVVV